MTQEVADPLSATDAPVEMAQTELRSLRSRAVKYAPLLLVGGAVVFNLARLTAETEYTPLVNDGSVHAQMVRYATSYFDSGSLPLHGWYPYLGLGSPQFLHYQSLAAMLTGLVGTFTGADRAFNWSLYLLWSLWPVSIYLSSRLFGWNRWVAGVAAACASTLFSVPGVGFEAQAYLWIGFGVWSQLFAMWTLPFAWAFSWRAIALRKPMWPAVLFIALTICFHYITGYIAILAAPVWILVRPTEIWQRFKRLSIMGIATFVVASWALVPLMVYGKWASINEVLQNTPDVNSYGAKQVLDWLFTGQIFDSGRWAVVTILAGIGFIECLRKSRHDEKARALVCIFIFSLVLFFGRPTLGPIINLLPRSHDLFLRRFMFGVQLSGLVLAGVGAVAAVGWLTAAARKVPIRAVSSVLAKRLPPLVAPLLAIVAVVVFLAPAWTELNSYYSDDSANIAYQQSADLTAGEQMQAIASAISVLGPGRVYAGLPTNWGENFDVGEVPVFKYLSNLDFDVVGYTLRTASLMTDPESSFVETNPADYQIFGVRYLVIPSNRTPPVTGRFITQSGIYQLWMLPAVTGYFQLAETTPAIVENRSNIGSQNLTYMETSDASLALYPSVAYSGSPGAAPTDPTGAVPTGSLGAVISQSLDLMDNQASVTVTANRTAVLVMKVSYDPGWQATVDGSPVSTEMVAPALVGVLIGPGTHYITFRYVGYQHYLILIVLGGLVLLLCIFGRQLERLIRRTTSGERALSRLDRFRHDSRNSI